MTMAINVGALYGVLIWGSMYDATATGLDASKPMIYVMILYAVATVIAFRAGMGEGWRGRLNAGGSVKW